MVKKVANKAPHLVTGAAGEDEAAAFILKNGLSILARNWRPATHFGARANSLELDIIARDKAELVFIEVKSRRQAADSPFSPLDAFSKAKRTHIMRAAALYLEEHQAWSQICRFDLICIVFKPDSTSSLEHYKNVLSFDSRSRGALGGSNTAWQPW